MPYKFPMPLKIVLVDDASEDRGLIFRALGENLKQKYDFVEFSNGEDAVVYLKSNPMPDCMLLDLNMPLMNGTRTLTELKKLFGAVPLPVLMLTGSFAKKLDDFDEATRAIDLGAQDFAAKESILPQPLARAVRGAIERFQLLRDIREKDEQYRLATEAANLGTWNYNYEQGIVQCTDRCREIMELPKEIPIDLGQFFAAVVAEDKERLRRTFHAASKSQDRALQSEFRIQTLAGGLRWVFLSGRAQNLDETHAKLMGTALDVTERKHIETQRLEELQMLDALFRVGQVFATNIHGSSALQLAAEIGAELTKAQFAAFVFSAVDPKDTKFVLHTHSSNHRNIFDNFEIPASGLLARDPSGAPLVIRSDDIQQDSTEGLAQAIPKIDFNIASYMAVPVTSKQGQVWGTLIFGHAKVAMFDGREERIAKAIATQISVGLENQRLVGEIVSSETRWRNVAEAMPQLVWIVSRADGACGYLNSQWQDYTGIENEKLLGFGWLDVIHPEDKDRVMEAWQNAIEGKAGYNIEFRILHRDGEYRWFKTRGVSVEDREGKPQTWYGTCTEIQELIESRDAAQAASVAKSEFLANMSHEIRTPMNAVIGLANILSMSQPLTSRQREFVSTLQTSADSLLSLINDLLDIAKIENRTVDLEKIPFSMTALIEDVIKMMSVRVKEKDLKFASDLKSIENKMFVGDPTRIRQIVLNLCSNAIKFTSEGMVTLFVECWGAEAPNTEMVSIAVKDTGIGINPDKVGSIFQKFTQADTTINRKYGGTGLGLAITKTLVELMGGTILVESEEGKGSKFIVEFTLERGASIDRQNKADKVEAPHPKDAGISLKAKILLVEDYEPNIFVARTFLEGFGYEVDVAMNGYEAFEQVIRNRYAVVLMDVQMHEMNGFEATKLIREREAKNKSGRVPIIGMTAHAMAGDREKCLAVGMDDYIPKPFHPDHLEMTIEKAINQRVS